MSQGSSSRDGLESETFHFPPDVFASLLAAIPRLFKSKREVIAFFQGAGSPPDILADIRSSLAADSASLSKFDIATTVLTRLNERGDRALAARREVIKRVTEFEDFSNTWADDQLKAKGAVADLRQLVGKKDAFTRLQTERDREAETRRLKARAETDERVQRRDRLMQVKSRLFGLFAETDFHARGNQLEPVLNDLFRASGILVHESFRRVGVETGGTVEQIDGVIALDGEIYLVEMKWWANKLGPAEIAQHAVRVFQREQVRGLLISASGFTAAAVTSCRESLPKLLMALCTLEEIVGLLDAERDLGDFLRRKVYAAQIQKDPFGSIDLSALPPS